ncbi:MAG: carboxypeptidase-like regulatory domain-containing protein [bacterium]
MKKRTIHLLLALTLIHACFAVGMGQSKKISIRSKNESLRHVLNEISQQSNIQFIFDDKLVNGKIVKCDIQAKTTQDALKEILDGFGLAFREVQEDRIVLYEQPPQEKRFKLTGRVTDASTGQPLYFANVFLSGTTLGCATDKDGHYTIENIPSGHYELVASMMGYQLQSMTIDLKEPIKRETHFQLAPVPIKAPQLSVSAPYPHEWKANLKKFEELFLGTSENAAQCKILNPEYLDFETGKSTGGLKAKTSKPLQIENRALGYRVVLYLEDFFSPDDASVSCIYRSHFEPLQPKDEAEEETWARNRLKVYRGSLRHFLTALISENLEEEGFLVYKVPDMSDSKKNVPLGKKAQAYLLSSEETPFERKFSFPDYLGVAFMKEEESEQYPRGNRQRAGMQSSWLKMDVDTVSIDLSGRLGNPYAITSTGYMGWERFAEVLPLDYTPPIQMQPDILTPITDETVSSEYDSFSARHRSSSLLKIANLDPVELLKHARTLSSEKNVDETTTVFYEGLENLGNHPYADTLFKEIFDIMTEKEQNAYKKAPDKGKYLLTFWQRQDPTPATLENERLIEHWERLDYIRRWYSIGTLGYDDRGRIYLQYGPPDDCVRMVMPGGLYPNECWIYNRFGREIVFDFFDKHGFYQMLPPDRSNITPAADTLGIIVSLYEFIDNRAGVSFHYTTLQSAIKLTGGPTFEKIRQIEREMYHSYQENTVNQSNLPQVTTDFKKPTLPLHAAIAMARFYPQNLPRLEIYLGVPFDQISMEENTDGDSFSDLDIAYIVRDSSYAILAQKNMRRTVQLPAGTSPQNRIYINQFNEILSPGDYTIAVEIKNPQANKAFERAYSLSIPKTSNERLQLSDIELAHKIEPITEEAINRAFMKNDLSVLPYPSFTISKRQPIHLYFEVYNLMFGRDGMTSYEIEYSLRSSKTSFFQKILPFGKKSSQSASYQQNGDQKNTQEYFALDFGKVKTGEYTLTVNVKDLVAGQSEMSEIQIQVVE